MEKFIIRQDAEEKLHLYKDKEEISPKDILSIFPKTRVYAFDGEMGAGKTTFIKTLSEALGVTDVVNSPTFAIVNEYEVNTTLMDGKNIHKIFHFDCYRLKNMAEAMNIGTEDYLYSGELCFIEWPNVIENLLPENTVWVKIKVGANGDRTLELE